MEEKNKVNIFSDPEVIDTVINTKLASFPRHNGSGNSMKTKWTDEELELMDCVIMEYIVKQGLSREKLQNKFSQDGTLLLKQQDDTFLKVLNVFVNDMPKVTGMNKLEFGNKE